MLRPLRHAAVIATLACAAAVEPAAAEIEPHAGMLLYPDVGTDKIVFVYANDIWTVDRQGGQAVPLASPPGQEQHPKFSPDGSTIAFMGNYEGNPDIYTIPVTGGVPHRVTHHPTAETLCDWTPCAKLLFFAPGITGMPLTNQLFTVPADGGLPHKIPVPYGTIAAISPDGLWLAYTPNTRDTQTWKRYRGGMATDIWLFNLQTHESRLATDWEGTDTRPMWFRDRLYYLSDRGDHHKLNIWLYDPDSDTHTQITRFRDYDVKWPSIGPGENNQGEIVFQNGPALFLLDLKTRSATEVKVVIPGARPTIRPKRVDASDLLTWWDISSTGKRAVVEARGDVWTLPAENGAVRNLTRTSGAHERWPRWSPDGKWVAYFSDATGEYELCITQSDGKGENRQLTHDSQTFYQGLIWSPDSKHIAYIDKASNARLYTIETGQSKFIDKDSWGELAGASWSHDSRWIAYAKSDQDKPTSAVWLYNIESDEHHQVTAGMFNDVWPTFDRKGEHLYFASSRNFHPKHSELDSSFIYDQSQVLIAVPLRDEVKSPWLLESDEETWEEEEPEESEEAEEAEEAGEAEDAEDAEQADGEQPQPDDEDQDADTDRHPLHGVWEGSVNGLRAMLEPSMPPGAGIEIPDSAPLRLEIFVDDEGNISGNSTVEILGQSQTEDLGQVTFNEDTGEYVEIDEKEGNKSVMRGTLEGDTISGTWEVSGNLNGSGTWSVTKTDEELEEPEEEAAEIVEIDLDGFEARAFRIPVDPGNFNSLAVNDKNQLLYVRRGDKGGIKLFDLDDDKKAEKTVAAGANAFEISGDGKKIIIQRGRKLAIQNAAAGGSPKNVVMTGMTASINPREEWSQIFHEAWRLYRDFFYVQNMHNVDWPAVRDRYAAMLDDCVTRDDVSYVIREMIAELNIGHAYYFGGDVEDQPNVNVGLLGADFELHDGMYRFARIYRGAPWDVQARGPLSEQGLAVSEGDYLVAVNGVPVDTDKDPWAAFIGTAMRETILTIKGPPECEDEDAEHADKNDNDDNDDDQAEDELEERDVVVKPARSEFILRYRNWIERNRAHVDQQSGGDVGYIYVPNTSRMGQNELVRQYFGQTDKKALIIDERWNGGGQIPTRFIELLNRPITNYWARRDHHDWKWPPDAQHGPKCMLINGLAGSGGDMFPWLFRYNKLGKLIGTRTWGGLVGLSGNPSLIDGGYVSVPTIGFYEKDGTWGIEGHGVDPDIQVIDDPALMTDGGDPQLDVAIQHMIDEIRRNPYLPPTRPSDPDRSGMGVREEDK